MLSRVDTILERDGQTDGQADELTELLTRDKKIVIFNK